jgi:uncharacterized protein (TIGR02246 family)
MRITSSLVVAGLLFGCQTMQSPETTKAEVGAATQAWADALNKCDPGRISALYDPQGVLWGTVSPAISTGIGIRQYFDRVCGSLTPPKVAFAEQLVRVYGDTAVNSGSYTFTVVRDGKPTPLPARYSMTFRKSDGQWLIVDHHSSLRPVPPKP